MIAVVVTLLAVFRLEPRQTICNDTPHGAEPSRGSGHFRAALRQVWSEAEARHFTIFVFVSMLAYSAQDLILEPYAGVVFSMTPGQSTQLAGMQHGGVLLGMLLVAATTLARRNAGPRVLRTWTVGGCIASAAALFGIAVGGRFAADSFSVSPMVRLPWRLSRP
ncbi:unnamed protein product [Ectocarpus sp. 12 AP-2014]